MLNQNSFQKNGLLKVNSQIKPNNTINDDKLGRRTTQEIRDDMWNAKKNVIFNNKEKMNQNLPVDRQVVDHRNKIENIRNINRWNS